MPKKSETIQLHELDTRTLEIPLVGDSPLICHNWSHKAKEEMLGKQTGKARQKKEIRDPEQEYRESLYPHEKGGYGFPAVAFKAAAVRAANDAGMAMTETRRAFHVQGDLVQIHGTPRMREDMVRISGGKAMTRYRAEFPEWNCILRVTYNARTISAEQLVNLFNIAGFGVGIGEWRPEKSATGTFGRFHVATEGDLA